MKITISELRDIVRQVMVEHFGGVSRRIKVDPDVSRKIDSFAFDISVGSDELEPYGYSGDGRVPDELVARLGEILGVSEVTKEELKYFVDVLDCELMGMGSP